MRMSHAPSDNLLTIVAHLFCGGAPIFLRHSLMACGDYCGNCSNPCVRYFRSSPLSVAACSAPYEHRARCSAEYVFEHACFSVALAGFCSNVALSSRDSFWRMNSNSACLLLLSFPCWHMFWCSSAHAVLPHRDRHIGRGNNRLVLCLLGVGQHMTACTELLLLKFRIPPRRSLASCLCLIILSSCAPVYVLQFYTL